MDHIKSGKYVIVKKVKTNSQGTKQKGIQTYANIKGFWKLMLWNHFNHDLKNNLINFIVNNW